MKYILINVSNLSMKLYMSNHMEKFGLEEISSLKWKCLIYN